MQGMYMQGYICRDAHAGACTWRYRCMHMHMRVHARVHLKARPADAHCMPTACPLHAHCMPTACPLHAHCRYTGIAALALLRALDQLPYQERVVDWCIARQIGGFQGRPNKVRPLVPPVRRPQPSVSRSTGCVVVVACRLPYAIAHAWPTPTVPSLTGRAADCEVPLFGRTRTRATRFGSGPRSAFSAPRS